MVPDPGAIREAISVRVDDETAGHLKPGANHASETGALAANQRGVAAVDDGACLFGVKRDHFAAPAPGVPRSARSPPVSLPTMIRLPDT